MIPKNNSILTSRRWKRAYSHRYRVKLVLGQSTTTDCSFAIVLLCKLQALWSKYFRLPTVACTRRSSNHQSFAKLLRRQTFALFKNFYVFLYFEGSFPWKRSRRSEILDKLCQDQDSTRKSEVNWKRLLNLRDIHFSFTNHWVSSARSILSQRTLATNHTCPHMLRNAFPRKSFACFLRRWNNILDSKRSLEWWRWIFQHTWFRPRYW